MEIFSVLAVDVFIVRFNVVMESQPAELVSVSLYVPAVLYSAPFQVYGNWLGHKVTDWVVVRVGLTVNMSVTIESQPLLLVSVSL